MAQLQDSLPSKFCDRPKLGSKDGAMRRFYCSDPDSTKRKSLFKNVFSPVSVSTVALIKLVRITNSFAM